MSGQDRPGKPLDVIGSPCYRPGQLRKNPMTIPSDPEAIRVLAHILRDTGLTEIEIVSGEDRIRLVRAPAVTYVAPSPSPSAAPAPVTTHAGPLAAEEVANPGAVSSPMVGVAYLSAEPGAAPFVVPGQTVSAGQTVLLIEAMKTFNQIKAPRAGILTRILVTSGQPVEYDQPLFVID